MTRPVVLVLLFISYQGRGISRIPVITCLLFMYDDHNVTLLLVLMYYPYHLCIFTQIGTNSSCSITSFPLLKIQLRTYYSSVIRRPVYSLRKIPSHMSYTVPSVRCLKSLNFCSSYITDLLL